MRSLPTPKVRSRQIVDADIDGVVDLLTRGFNLRNRDYWQHALEKLSTHPTPAGMPKYGYLLEGGGDLVSRHIANVVLGPDFRSVVGAVMPIVSVAVIFQIMSYQYLHIIFLLSERNAFYLLNTGSVLAFNAVVTYLLIGRYGMIGAAWGRLAAELFGFLGALALTRWAFPVPLPLSRLMRVLIAAIVMAIVVRGL
jgi:hypothetical protein